MVTKGGHIAWRLWFLQASWNREGMQSMGMAVCALPWARRRGLRGAELAGWLRARLDYANTNPYLAGLALAPALRLSEEGDETGARRLETTLSRVLGAVGDALFWEGLRPAWALLTLTAAFVLGPWAVLAGWLVFAGAMGLLRQWCWSQGWQRGGRVIELVDRPVVGRVVEASASVAAAAAGLTMAVGYLAASPPLPSMGALAWGAAALACGLLALKRRWPVEWFLPALALAGWLLSHLRSGI